MINNIDSTQNISLSTILSETTSSAQKQTKRMQDTIATTERSEKEKQVEINNRPALPKAQPSKDRNFMTLLAEAFSKSYDAVSEGTVVEDQDYDRIQTVTLTMSEAILTETQKTVLKENQMAKTVHDQEVAQKSEAKTDDIINTVEMVAVAVLIVGTVASAALDGGLSLAALPEELTGLFGLAGEESAEAGGEAIEMGSMSAEGAEVAEGADSEGTAATEAENNISQSNEAENNNELSKDQAKTNKPTTRARVKKMLIRTVLSAAFGAPQLVQGIQGIENASVLKQLANEQKDIGTGFAVMQMNNSYNEFFQKILQRKSGVISEQTNEATEIVKKYGDIMNAYRQISYGLARAV